MLCCELLPGHLASSPVETEKQRIGLGGSDGLLSLTLTWDQQKESTWLLVKGPLGAA